MSDLEAAFLADIKANPHDWLPRLVFADWLEEQGDERGELIRLSYDLTRLACEDRSQKEARLQELRIAGVEWPSPKQENRYGLEFVLVPPGEFLMGSPPEEDGRGNSEEQVEVRLSRGFWIGKYPLTNVEYDRILNARWTAKNSQRRGEDVSRHPTAFWSWGALQEICGKLTNRSFRAGHIPAGWHFQLPTEAQWEYACRAGTTTPFGFGTSLTHKDANIDPRYPYGATENSATPDLPLSQTETNPLTLPYMEQTVAVDTYSPNAWGLHDFHGNVCEMCLDWFTHELPGGIDPVVTEETEARVVRSGSWSAGGRFCRSATRKQGRIVATGFRLVLCSTKTHPY